MKKRKRYTSKYEMTCERRAHAVWERANSASVSLTRASLSAAVSDKLTFRITKQTFNQRQTSFTFKILCKKLLNKNLQSYQDSSWW